MLSSRQLSIWQGWNKVNKATNRLLSEGEMAMLPGSRETGSALGVSLLRRMPMLGLHQAVWIFEVLLPFRAE